MWWRLVPVLLLSACVHEPLPPAVPELPMPASLREAFEQIDGVGGPSGVVVLSDNAQAWAARWEMLGDARQRIDASYFIVANDLFGRAFIAHLYERALHGVKVRLLVDGRGTGPLLAPLAGLDEMQELVATGNATVRVYNPPLTRIAQTLLQLSAVPVAASTHEKILVVDGEIGLSGGRNIGTPYFTTPEEDPRAFIDADVLVNGEDTVLDLERQVNDVVNAERLRPDTVNGISRHDELLMIYGAMDAWVRGTVPDKPAADAALALEAAGLAQLPRLPDQAVRANVRPLLRKLAQLTSIYGTVPIADLHAHDADVRIVTSPGRAEGSIENPATDALVRCLDGARHRVLFETPYFLLTPRMLSAMRFAADRGVEIDVFTNSPNSSDNDMSQALFIDTWPKLEELVPTLRIFAAAHKQTLHGKRAAFDDELSTVGSYNLDPLSAHLNSELIVFAWSRELNAATRKSIERRMTDGDVVEYRIRRDAEGRAVHNPDGSVAVAYGPRSHVTRKRIEDLESLKHFLLTLRGIWDFRWVVF